MNYFLSFAESTSPNVVGGKGHGLHRLESWGFQIPKGYVVPAEIYRQELAANSIGPSADQLDRATEEELLKFAADMRSAISGMTFNSQFLDEIGAIWESISGEGGGEFANLLDKPHERTRRPPRRIRRIIFFADELLEFSDC